MSLLYDIKETDNAAVLSKSNAAVTFSGLGKVNEQPRAYIL
jgi:hypothetical protein